MNNDFSRIITLLRKEKKLSQKQAAQDLGISQALLSHYEKGIRECGLEFLVRAADYYNVSCDYLLGRTPDRYNDIEDYTDETYTKDRNVTTQKVNKRLIQNTLGVIYDYLVRISNRKLSNYISNYLMIATYTIFRKIYSANEINPQAMFAIDKHKYCGYSKASMQILETEIDAMTEFNNEHDYVKSLADMSISPDTLVSEYPQTASSVFNLVQHAEAYIKAKK